MAVKLSPVFNDAQLDSSGNPYSGAKLFAYAAGSTTKQTAYQDSAGTTPHTNPIVLNSRGEPPAPIWLTTGQTYKLYLTTPTDTDPPITSVRVIDNVTGVNDTTSAVDQWIGGATPTYVSATSFTLSGDQTTTYHIARRLKSTNSGGTIYSTITGSSYSGGTGLTTIIVTNDSGSLDSGLSAISYGIVSAASSAVPGLTNLADIVALSAAGTIRGVSAPPVPINLSLAFSVAGSALTIAIKDRAGNDPSSASPVLIPFRNATAATGDYSWLAITSATSFTVSSGSTLGARNGVAFRGWVVAFNDAGTLRIGVINCVTSAAGSGAGSVITAIYPLAGFGIASSTAEGGAGAADSAQTFYTGSAVSSKAYTVLGYFSYESGLATAGTYASTPTRSQLWMPGMPLPGTVLQSPRTDTGAVATGTTTIPGDDTIPQSGEGDQYMTQAITPSSAANVLRVTGQFVGTNTAGVTYNLIAALFQDATANALAAVIDAETTGELIAVIALSYLMLAGTTSATTLKLRAGAASAGTTTFNGRASARLMGGVMNSFLQVEEVMG